MELTVVTGATGAHYVLVYAAKDANVLANNRAQMQEAERTFRALTPADKAAAKAWTLRTTQMPRGGFAELARSSPLANPEQQLKLINGVYAGGEIKPGTPVKVVVQ
jgi:predicted Zn-dependent protease